MLNQEQKDFIKRNMIDVISKCQKDIDKYGFYDACSIGIIDAIEIAQSIINEMDK